MLLLIADRRAGHLAVAERAELLPYGTITSPIPEPTAARNAWLARKLPEKCARSSKILMLMILNYEQARAAQHPPFHLSARLSDGLRPRCRGDRRQAYRSRPRLESTDLYGRGRLRQGRPLCRAHPSPRAAGLSDAPHRTERLRAVRAYLLGRGAGRDRSTLQSGRARVRTGIRLALLLRRHHGPGDARRHQPADPCEEIFALLFDDLCQHRPRRLCDRY